VKEVMVMKRTTQFGFALFALICVAAVIAAGQSRRTVVERPVRESSEPRRNIGAFFDKCRAGKPVTVAYLGGSIMAGAGAGDPNKTSYRAIATEWLRQEYPRSLITEINASVAGTGSLYGAMRARRDVIAHKPDLVLIDFAANDANDPEDAVKKSLEGMARQLLGVPQPPEIVLLYSGGARRLTQTEWYELIAGYYHLPSIEFQQKAADAADSSKASVKDGNEVSDEVHKAYASEIIGFFQQQAALSPSPSLKSLQPPLLSDEMTYGELKPFAEIKHGAPWHTESSTDRALPSTLLTSDKVGAQIEFLFEGTALGVVFRAGPDAGSFECLIDGHPAPSPLARVDGYQTSHRIKAEIIAGGLSPGEHRLTIRIADTHHPKSTGHQVRLGYLLVGGQRPERL